MVVRAGARVPGRGAGGAEDPRRRHDLRLPGLQHVGVRAVARRALEVADEVVFVGPQSARARKLARLAALLRVRDRAARRPTTSGRPLRDGDLVVLKGSNRADHLMRILLARDRDRPLLARRRAAACASCDGCRLLRVPGRYTRGERPRRSPRNARHFGVGRDREVVEVRDHALPERRWRAGSRRCRRRQRVERVARRAGAEAPAPLERERVEQAERAVADRERVELRPQVLARAERRVDPRVLVLAAAASSGMPTCSTLETFLPSRKYSTVESPLPLPRV